MPGGAPSYEPTEKDRAQVETLASYGIPEEGIARLVINPRTGKGITAKTLRKHFREELDVGLTKSTAQVVQSLYRQCLGADAVYDANGNKLRDEIKPYAPAAMFWCKVHLGWREKSDIEVSGKNGGPIPLVITKNESNY